jgi:hypothetical protein
VLGVPVDDVLTMAGHRPADLDFPPGDPRRELHALIDRIEWNSESFDLVNDILQGLSIRQRRTHLLTQPDGGTVGRAQR